MSVILVGALADTTREAGLKHGHPRKQASEHFSPTEQEWSLHRLEIPASRVRFAELAPRVLTGRSVKVASYFGIVVEVVRVPPALTILIGVWCSDRIRDSGSCGLSLILSTPTTSE